LESQVRLSVERGDCQLSGAIGWLSWTIVWLSGAGRGPFPADLDDWLAESHTGVMACIEWLAVACPAASRLAVRIPCWIAADTPILGFCRPTKLGYYTK
jgi:hypothetical protein